MNPTALWIPELKYLWDRDKSPDKEMASKEITYVVFKNAYKSPYDGFSEQKRAKKLIADYFTNRGIKGWKPDKHVEAAEKKFLEILND